MRRLAGGLAVACCALLPLASAAQGQRNGLAPRYFITSGAQSDSFGYVRYLGGPSPLHSEQRNGGPDRFWRPALQMTILTRNGRAVTGADVPAATEAAQAICAAERLDWERSARGRLLTRGGILFSGACG